MIKFTVSANSSCFDIRLKMLSLDGSEYNMEFHNVDMDFISNIINGTFDLDKYVSIKFGGQSRAKLCAMLEDVTLL